MMEEENEPALAVSHKGFLKVTSFTGQFIPRSSFEPICSKLWEPSEHRERNRLGSEWNASLHS